MPPSPCCCGERCLGPAGCCCFCFLGPMESVLKMLISKRLSTARVSARVQYKPKTVSVVLSSAVHPRLSESRYPTHQLSERLKLVTAHVQLQDGGHYIRRCVHNAAMAYSLWSKRERMLHYRSSVSCYSTIPRVLILSVIQLSEQNRLSEHINRKCCTELLG